MTRAATLWLPPLLAMTAAGWAVPTRPSGPASSAPAPTVQPRWRAFAPPGGGFSALLPVTPRARTTVFRDGSLLHVFTGTATETVYSIQYHDEPPQSVAGLGPARIIAITRDALERSTDAKRISREAVTRNGLVGQQTTAARPHGRQETFRIFLAGGRLYVLLVFRPAADPAAALDADKFLNSFTLLPAGTPNAAQKKHL